MKLTENLKAVLLLMAAFAAVSPVMQAKDRISRNFRPYEEGPLRWEEFRQKITHADSTSATILNVWRPETSKEKFGNMVVRRMVMRNYFDKDGSWVSPESRSDQNLKYLQTIFDISELYKRKTQRRLDIFSPRLATEIDSLNTERLNTLEELRKESSFGNDAAAVERYAAEVGEELSECPVEEYSVPEFSCNNFIYGMYLGFGAMAPFGKSARYFAPAYSFLFGFEFGYKRSSLYVDASSGAGKVREALPSTTMWQASDIFAYSNLNLLYRYAVVDSDSWKLGPLTGISYAAYERFISKSELDPLARDLDGIKFSLGIEADWKYRKLLNLTTIPGEYVESTLKARLYASREQYFNAFGGWSLNFSLIFNWSGRVLKFTAE